MKLKACLHCHVQGDPCDNIRYSPFTFLDAAKIAQYDVVCITCHDKIIFTPELQSYAEQLKILLIPGIEKTIQRKHVLIINAHQTAEQIETFEQLRQYKTKHPESLIIAPHPYFKVPNCLEKYLEANIDLFDAIEWNYFYHKKINFNLKAKQIAKKYNLPIVGTSDVHLLKYLNPTYSIIDCEEKTIESFLNAIRKNQVDIITKSFSIWELFKILFSMFLKN